MGSTSDCILRFNFSITSDQLLRVKIEAFDCLAQSKEVLRLIIARQGFDNVCFTRLTPLVTS